MRRRQGKTALLWGVLVSGLLPWQPTGAEFIENTAVVRDGDNDLLFSGIASANALHAGLLVPAFSPDPVIGLSAELAAYGANIVLKYIPPTLTQPGDRTVTPNSADQCTYDFTMPQTSWKRVDYLGLLRLSKVPDDWGALGKPEVYHANTDVVVRAVNQYIPLADSPPREGIFANAQPVNAGVSFPSGNHVVRWEAEAQLDPIMDLYIPPILALAATEFRYASTGLDASADAAKTLAKTQRVKQVALGVLQEAGVLLAGEAVDEFDLPDFLQGQQTAAHHRLQTVTVRDVLPPTLHLRQQAFTFEASNFGGTPRSSFWEQNVAPTIVATDPCGRAVSVTDDAPRQFFPLGTTMVEVSASDLGPNLLGERNTVTGPFQLAITIEDTQAPILVAPPSRVVEVSAGEQGLDPVALMLGSPLVADLADASPNIENDGPAFYPVDTRANIIWTATDDSGNSSTARQFVTVKTAGTNTAPTADDVSASTLTSQPVDIVLRGSDADFLDGQFDPVSFNIETPPARGEFVAPLLPFFIDDYRTNPAGPYGDDFRLGVGFGGNRFQWMFANVCEAAVNPIEGLAPRQFASDWVYQPSYVDVQDDGTYFMLDKGWSCKLNQADTEARISKWSRDGEYLGAISYTGNFDHFVLDEDGFIYMLRREGGSRNELFIRRCGSAFEEQNGGYCGSSWKFDFASAEDIRPERLAYARVDAKRGLLFLSDAVRLFVFDIRDTPVTQPGDAFVTYRPPHVGTLFNNERLYGAVLATGGSSCSANTKSGYAIDLDRDGNLYAADTCDSRVHKFEPSSLSASGDFQAGAYVGWMGYCTGSTNKACDIDKQRSKGYSCTNDTCSVPAPRDTKGSEPGQFSGVAQLVVGPEDILYVADPGNNRIQRFGPDGTFAGQAVSSGTGVNQGERSGFVLGNFGRPSTVSVNRSNFFVVDPDAELVHIFQTSPFKDITDNSATVTYVSQFDAHSITDTFTYSATDGLATSVPGVAMVEVNRNFRAPEAIAQDNIVVLEDGEVEITLAGDDPDGIAGVDFNGLDTLSFRVVREPRSGALSGAGTVLTYTPEPDFFGEDYFLFVANDALEDSAPARVDINVVAVDDAPRVTEFDLPDTWGRGLPLLVSGTFFDDGSTSYDTRIEWGDGVVSSRGDFVEDENGTRLEGVKLVEPYDGVGRGQAIAEHTFTANASRTARLCVSDQDGKETCKEDDLSVLPLVMLQPDVFVPVESVPQGETSVVAVTLRNVQPFGYDGLPATNVRFVQRDNTELEVVGMTGAPTGCVVVEGLLDCTIAVMLPGSLVSFTVDVRSRGAEFFDAQESFTMAASNITPAVVPTALATAIVSFSADLTDGDGDGLSDAWESEFGLNPAVDDAALDSDGDGLSNAAEYANRTDPQNADTDRDGIPDGVEVDSRTNPTVAADTDSDGRANDVDLDDDNDGMSDVFERRFGLDALIADDALLDLDGDGVTNLAEALAGTDPADAGDLPPANTAASTLFSSVLPLNRATVVDGTVSAFATILNTGEAANGCGMAPITPLESQYSFQLTNPATNEPTGAVNEPGSIAAGAAQSFVFQFTPRATMNENIAFRFACDGVPAANTVVGVNTFVLQANQNPTADVVALAATITNDGVVSIANGAGAFSVASVNVGEAGFLTARTRIRSGLSLNTALCQTDPLTAACINPAVPGVDATTYFDNNATPTFSVFVANTGPVEFDPASNRVFVEFLDADGVVRGATSVAVRVE